MGLQEAKPQEMLGGPKIDLSQMEKCPDAIDVVDLGGADIFAEPAEDETFVVRVGAEAAGMEISPAAGLIGGTENLRGLLRYSMPRLEDLTLRGQNEMKPEGERMVRTRMSFVGMGFQIPVAPRPPQ